MDFTDWDVVALYRKTLNYNGVDFVKDVRAFLIFSSASHDETYFDDPNQFDPWQDTSKSIPFGAGPHFCAGAWASRSLVVNVALPAIFDAFPNMAIYGSLEFNGWAFRDPLKVPVTR